MKSMSLKEWVFTIVSAPILLFVFWWTLCFVCYIDDGYGLPDWVRFNSWVKSTLMSK